MLSSSYHCPARRPGAQPHGRPSPESLRSSADPRFLDVYVGSRHAPTANTAVMPKTDDGLWLPNAHRTIALHQLAEIRRRAQRGRHGCHHQVTTHLVAATTHHQSHLLAALRPLHLTQAETVLYRRRHAEVSAISRQSAGVVTTNHYALTTPSLSNEKLCASITLPRTSRRSTT
ncbi:hypothetical protein DFP72DRAFT_1082308 [Ephemerocybe angulata]|uniref:Uncharacterized protein n=1 Tax=Ephemerocybe angulata TaxID=980116 RepID=A0A8H6H867_9AGAR|nr:hypothetical protein DFP72DRAFT_1082308 [Tulosesus angulatus]